ncbi:alpha/beta fold hydrolase [Amycolatopsis sp. H20-H5]|uniref:alpha/beta fold hydrolase n=1 Tax=Amycolatopsis sp. H20-H5 TaxID=3046309 RepID=UPI002DB88A5F|nr:alpha/beta fold hydrolase [Amycolatopsis sp. H20-H5]MEC3977529.1 alpha/beta fold hydrolase [Amycolatopsis sp. H20-H5]
MPEEDDYDVLVVGGGPTGMTAACELLRRGVRVRVIDAAPQPSVHSKAMLVWPRTVDILEDLGLAGEVAEIAVKLRQMTYYSEKKVTTRLQMDEGLAPFCLPQRHTEEILAVGLKGLGGQVERNVRLLSLQGVDFSGQIRPEQRITAVLELPDGTVERMRVPWVIGADGATSVVRNQLGIAYEGATYENRFLITDARIAGDPLDPDEVHYHQSRIGVLAIVPQPYGLFRFFTNAPADVENGTLADMQSLVDVRGPGGLKLIEPDWVTTFRVHRRRAASFQLGRVFIAGDAAHAHSPMGGQGLNTGIQDAHNLAWKLASVIRGDAFPSVLENYTPERAEVADAVVRDTDLQTRMAMWNKGPQVALRDLAMRTLDKTKLLNRYYIPIAAGRRWVYEEPGAVKMEMCDLRAALRRHSKAGAALPRELSVELGVTGPGVDPNRYSVVVMPGAENELAGLHAALTHLIEPWSRQVRVIAVGNRKLKTARQQLHCRRPGFYLVRPDGHVAMHGHQDDLDKLYHRLGTLLVPREKPVVNTSPESDTVEDTVTSANNNYVPPARVVGNGPHKVIVLHALFADHQYFEHFWSFVDTTKYSYAFMDARGYGKAFDVPGTYITDEIASDVLTLADSLGWNSFSLIGHSLGGMPAQQVFLKAPHRVRKLIGISPVPANGMPIPDSDFPLFADAAHSRENRKTILNLTTGHKLSDVWLNSFADASMQAVGPVAFRGYLDSFRTTDFSARVTGSDVATLAVVGENDPAVTADAMNETWMKHYPNSELAVIGNSGHYPMLETPIALATLLETFLDK